MADHEVIHIGDIVKPHGLKGEVVVVFHAEDHELLDHVSHVLLDDGRGGQQRRAVRSWREHQERVLLTLQGVADRNAAEALRGHQVLVPASQLPPADDDEVYLHQLEGCRVVLADGSELGVVEGFITPTAEQEIWVIRTPDGREVLFPAHDETVREVDLEAGRITIDPPPGLLEFYADQD